MTEHKNNNEYFKINNEIQNIVHNILYKELEDEKYVYLYRYTEKKINNHLLNICYKSYHFFIDNTNQINNSDNISLFFEYFPAIKDIINKTVYSCIGKYKRVLNFIQHNRLPTGELINFKDLEFITEYSSDFHSNYGSFLIKYNNKEIFVKIKLADFEKLYSHIFQSLQYNIIPNNIKYTSNIYYQNKITTNNVSNEKELYINIGRTIFTAYLLGCTDLHVENVYINGNEVDILDCECIYDYDDIEYKNGKNYSLFSSVLHTGLLPDSSTNGSIISGFSSEINKNSSKRTNVPYNIKLNLYKNTDLILEGFNEFYLRFLSKKKDYVSFIVKSSEETKKRRVLLHDTKDYYSVLLDSYHPYLLMDKEKRLDFIKKQGKLSKKEVMDLYYGIVPYITKDNKVTKSNFSKFKYLDAVRQSKIIKTTLSAEHEFYLFNHFKTNKFYSNNYSNDLSKFAITQKVINLLRYLENTSFEDNHGRKIWVDKVMSSQEDYASKYDYILITSPFNIYYGQAGLLLLLSKLEYITNKKFKLTSILKTQIKNNLEDSSRNIDDGNGLLGGDIGEILALIYSDINLANNKNLLNKINKCIDYSIDQKSLDFTEGISGIVYFLLFMKQHKIQNNYVDFFIKKSINYILKEYDSKFCGWHFNEMPGYVFGYAHGNIGLASSLSRVSSYYEVSNIKTIINNIVNKYFDSLQYNNWPISSYENRRVLNWCHGAPGILLGLSYCYNNCNHYNKKRIYKLALQLLPDILKCKHYSNCLCHGDFGNLIIYNKVKKNLNINISDKMEEKLINRILLSTFNSEIEASSISFMCGEVGILYYILDFVY